MKKAARIILIVLILAWVCLYVGSVWENYETSVEVKLDPVIMEEFDIDEDTAKGLLDATQVISGHREQELRYPVTGDDLLFEVRQTLAVRNGICILIDVYFPEYIYDEYAARDVYIGYPEFYVDGKLFNEENCDFTVKLVDDNEELFCRTYILTYSGGELEFEPFTPKALYKIMRLESAHIYDRSGKDVCDNYGLFNFSGIEWHLYNIDFDLSVK